MSEHSFETRIKLNQFVARDYQRPLFEAIEKKGIKRAVLVWHRRAGKDITCFVLLIRMAIREIGQYFYILPTFRQARLTLFQGITNSGMRFLDYLPSELVKAVNIQEMSIEFTNGSRIYFLGSDNYDSLRGSNPKGIVFSEYAFQHEAVYATVRPVLVANDGFAIFISTPFGDNFFHQIFLVAQQSPDWFCDLRTVEDTGVISAEAIDKEVKEGLMSPDMVAQEYYCSFSTGALGAYYSKYLNKLELEGQICEVPWEPSFKVNTAWDLGMRDETVIIFWQLIGNAIKIIDVYANSNVGLEHYIHVVLNKPYTYNKHIAPHDIKVRDFTAGGVSRWDKANNMGLKFTLCPDMSIIDGIETVRTTLPRIWLDRDKCKKLISAIRDYRRRYDEKLKRYDPRPLHDHNSNYADALRYLCVGLPLVKSVNSTPEELEMRYQQARMGGPMLPEPFRKPF